MRLVRRRGQQSLIVGVSSIHRLQNETKLVVRLHMRLSKKKWVEMLAYCMYIPGMAGKYG